MEYVINGKKLIWDCDETNGNASKLKDNDIFISLSKEAIVFAMASFT